jgi:peptidoglycan/xylan/chitin deacetylase (PgdA/CDA1 family)
MAETNRRIKAASGFEPCLFRPPGGAFNSRVVSDARRLGMTTVIWDVDPADWSRPGTSAIYSRVVSATRPGSIVIMHDGGGDRSQTVAALPRIIRTLRHRGYSFVTVTKLLGNHFVWRPVG